MSHCVITWAQQEFGTPRLRTSKKFRKKPEMSKEEYFSDFFRNFLGSGVWGPKLLEKVSTMFVQDLFEEGTANHTPSPRKTFLIGWYVGGGGVVCELSQPETKGKIHTTHSLHSRCRSSILGGWRVDFAV